MTICEFCSYNQQTGKCGLGLKPPQGMSCVEFTPSLEQFCSEQSDFRDADQIIQMASFFGIKRVEMKKVKLLVGWQGKACLKDPAARM